MCSAQRCQWSSRSWPETGQYCRRHPWPAHQRCGRRRQPGVRLWAGAGAETTAIQLALKGRTSFVAGEAETGISAIARIGWLIGDGGVRRYGVNGPVVAGRRWVTYCRRHLGPYLKGVGAVGQTGVRLRAGAAAETTAIQLALKGRTSFVAGEAETGISAIARIGRLIRDGGVRRYGVNGPVVAGRRRVSVAGAILSPYLKGVGAVGQAGVRLRAGAGTETTAIQLALKGRTSFVAGEAETGISAIARIGRLIRDGGVRRYGVNGPVVAGRRRVRVAGAILSPYLKGVGAVGQAGVRLRAGAGTETTAIQLALKGRTSFVAGEAETGISAIARIWWLIRDGGVRQCVDYEGCRDDVTACNRQTDGVCGADDIAAPIAKAPTICRCGFQFDNFVTIVVTLIGNLIHRTLSNSRNLQRVRVYIARSWIVVIVEKVDIYRVGYRDITNINACVGSHHRIGEGK